MAEPTRAQHTRAPAPGRAATAAYVLIDFLDRIWRRIQRDLNKAAAARERRP